MTVETTNVKTSYPGDDSQTAFAYNWKIYKSSDLLVLLETSEGVAAPKTLSVDYSVTGVGTGGGDVVMIVPPATGETLHIVSAMAILQEQAWGSVGKFDPNLIEQAIDRLTKIGQQLKEQQDRSLRLSLLAELAGLNLEIPAPEANKVIGWNPAGTELVNLAALGASQVVITTFGEELIALASKAAARAYLDVPTIAEVAAMITDPVEYVRFGPMGPVSPGSNIQLGLIGVPGDIVSMAVRLWGAVGSTATISITNNGAVVKSGIEVDPTGQVITENLDNVAVGALNMAGFSVSSVSGSPEHIGIALKIQPS